MGRGWGEEQRVGERRGEEGSVGKGGKRGRERVQRKGGKRGEEGGGKDEQQVKSLNTYIRRSITRYIRTQYSAYVCTAQYMHSTQTTHTYIHVSP